MGNNNQIAGLLLKEIRKITKQEIQKMKLIGYEVGVITAVNVGLVDVRLIGSTSDITDLPNKTGLTLVVDDNVYVYKIGSLTNAYVAHKLGNEVPFLLYDKNTLDLGFPSGLNVSSGAISIDFTPYSKVKVSFVAPYASYIVEATLDDLGSGDYNISGAGQLTDTPSTNLYVSSARVNSAKTAFNVISQGFWKMTTTTAFNDRSNSGGYFISRIEGIT